MCQNLTSGEFKNQHEIFISSCNTGSETSFQAGIYAITGMSLGRIASGMAQASLSTDPGLTFSLQAHRFRPPCLTRCTYVAQASLSTGSRSHLLPAGKKTGAGAPVQVNCL
jgi:hypothetical protein